MRINSAFAITCVFIAACLTISLSGCDRQKATEAASSPGTEPASDEAATPAQKGDLRGEALWPPETTGEYPIAKYANYDETGDLDAIRQRGKLRILVDVTHTDSLHRKATEQDIELQDARRFARSIGVEPVILYADHFKDLIPALVAGKGDIIANNLIMTDERDEVIDFTIPVSETRLAVISTKDAPDIKKLKSLKGKTLAVTKGTLYAEAAKEFAKDYPDVEIQVRDINYADLLLDVSHGHIDYTISETLTLDMVNQFRDNLKRNYLFPPDDQTAWGIRANTPKLQEALNAFLHQEKLTESLKPSTDDYAEISKRGFLRATTRNQFGTYYMWKGRVMGFEYELLQMAAKDMGLRLEIIVANSHEDLQKNLTNGHADVAASLLSITERRKKAGMAFGPIYLSTPVVLVSHKSGGATISDLQALTGKTITILKSSSHFDVAEELTRQIPGVEIAYAPELLNTHDVLDKISEGEYAYTIADQATVELALEDGADVRIDKVLKAEGNDYGWMMRTNNPELVAAIGEFFSKRENRKKIAALEKKYFKKPKKSRKEILSLNKKGQISPYDTVVRKYAEQFNFDWRLIVAQMFQESTFNPKAKSWVGAQGLLQVMPDTGKQMGEKNLFNPENGVRAGVKYLDWLHRKFEDKGITAENRMWFTLASYNAGLGHVYDAQDLAEEKGWNRNVWFEHVENAMLLLADKKYYSKARYGYARGREPYDYVRKIQARYRTYAQLLDDYERQKPAVSYIPGSGLLGLTYSKLIPSSVRYPRPLTIGRPLPVLP
ncbi:transporter substrate-binding domain-containing protein [uncultured Microbulbifer sp.]|uniref:transporter substrate-binding domain-containing protein n=1 Tax=uncultured Microbulbifer sp. TaxID=348147 RepID=UPI00260D6873|nr:transporter substrate-binding domain-containing protein [uncultured Microbulbifer sp.]